MKIDTTEINKHRHDLSGRESVWVFGYGSLIYKAGFPYFERKPATIQGWSRRFWQGSHDHRGTPERPGRVVTLVESDAACLGMAYRVAPEIFEHFDHREKNGYLRFSTEMQFGDGSSEEGLVYIGVPGNEAWLGDAPLDELAAHIFESHGPSGANSEYLLCLDVSLRALGAEDAHVYALADAVRALGATAPRLAQQSFV